MLTPFSALSHREQIHRLTALARTTLAAYPIEVARLRLIAHLWNTTFRIETPSGEKYMLRIHHPAQQSVESVHSEMLWLAALRADTPLQVPEPVQNREQEMVNVLTHPGVPEPRLTVLFHWIDGRFFCEGLRPAHLFRVGELMAQLHHHAAAWKPPAGFRRHRVDNLFCMQRDRNEDFDEAIAESAVRLVAEVMSAEAGGLVETAIRKVWNTLQALGQGREHCGLIHADLHQRNFLFHKGVAGAIDFDDCGFGHWLYDIAVSLSELQPRPDYPALRQGFLAGYRQNRSLSPEQEAQIETFLALRNIQNVIGIIEEREQPSFHGWWEACVTAELKSLRALIAEA